MLDRLAWRLDLRVRLFRHPVGMTRIELVPRRRTDGTVVFDAVRVTLVERIRRAVSRILGRSQRA